MTDTKKETLEVSTERPITREFCKAHRACYYDQPNGDFKVKRLVPAKGLTLLEGATLDIPPADVVWLFTRPASDRFPALLPDSILWEWTARIVERDLSRVEEPDPRILAVVTLLRRLAAGDTIPTEELAAAWTTARDAARTSARTSARAAAWTAAWTAARDAARDAARAAAAVSRASAAERKYQIEDLIELLGGMR